MSSANTMLARAAGTPALEPFSKTLERSLDKARWQGVLGKIARLSGSDCCVLGTSDLSSSIPTLVPAVRFGGSPAMIESMRGRLVALRAIPAGMVTVANGEHGAGRKREPIEPLSVVALSLVEGKQHSLVLAGCSHRKYDTDRTSAFERLAPRLCRLGGALESCRLAVTTAKALEATFNALATAVFLTDRDARVFSTNDAAQRLLSCKRGLCLRHGRLSTNDKLSTASLNEAIKQLSSGTRKHDRKSIVLRYRGDQGLLATVIALTSGDQDEVLDTGAVAVFVRDPDLAPLLPGEGFAKLYKLTDSELRLLLSMLPGRCIKGAAEAQGISEATARTHLHHIFMKTGTNKQVELVRLFSSYALPILAEPKGNL